MSGVFSIVLAISLLGSVVGLFAIIFRLGFKKIVGRSFIYVLWLFVLIRCLTPISFESSLSIFNFFDLSTPIEYYNRQLDNALNVDGLNGEKTATTNDASSIGTNNAESNNGLNNELNSGLNIESVNSTGTEFEQTSNTLSSDTTIGTTEIDVKVTTLGLLSLIPTKLLNTLGIVWGIGSLTLLILLIGMYIKIRETLKDKILVKTVSIKLKVYESSNIDSPVIFGFFRPSIVIPSALNLSSEQLEDVIRHERMHLRRLDYLAKPFWLLTLAIHWFNPIIVISYFLAMKDMEVSCDEKVLKEYNHKQRCHYADTLLEISLQQNNLSMNGLVAFGEHNIKSRVKSILSFKGIPLVIKIVSPVLIIVLFFMLVGHGLNNSADQATNLENSDDDGSSITDSNTTVEESNIPGNDALVDSSSSSNELNQGKTTEELLEIIMSSPKESSDSGDYVKAHREEYDAIINKGEEALKYMFSEFEKGNQTGLKGLLMRGLCGRILEGEDIKLETETGQEWYDELKAHTTHIYELNGIDFMEANYKYVTLLLNETSYYAYDMVNFSDGMVEIAGEKIGFIAQSQDELLKELSSKQIEQMMYRAVLFYKSAYNKDYETMKNHAGEALAGNIQTYAKDNNNPLELDVIMNFSDYTGSEYPRIISIPVKYGTHYNVELNSVISGVPSGNMSVSFTLNDRGDPIVSQIIFDKLVEGIMPYFNGVSIGMSIDDAINKLGQDYVKVDIRNGGYFIHYFGESLPVDKREYTIEGGNDGPVANLETGVDLFINFNRNTLIGFRILSNDYSLFDSLNVGDNIEYVKRICASSYEEYSFPDLIIDENGSFYELNVDYVLEIVADSSNKKVQAFYVVKKEFYYQ